MPPKVDPSDDYLLAENPVDVVFFSKVKEGVYNPANGAVVHYAEGFSIDKQASEASERLWLDGRVWYIWRKPMMAAGFGVTPKPEDKLVDPQGVTWEIKRVDGQSYGWVFRCTCLKAVS